MTTTIIIQREGKKLQKYCLESNSYYFLFNRWTLAIMTLLLLMVASVTLAIIFPYQGMVVVVDDDDGSSSDAKKNVITMGGSSNGDTAKQDSRDEKNNNNVFLSVDDDDDEEEHHSNTNSIGLFGSDATTTPDEQLQQPQQLQQVLSSSLSACQMKLQQADSNGDNLIDSSEYITFLRNNYNIAGGSGEQNTIVPPSITQFEELPNEYQVNFVHLAGIVNDGTTTAAAADGSGGGGDNAHAISIATMDEMQKVCLHTLLGEFDWDKISSLP